MREDGERCGRMVRDAGWWWEMREGGERCGRMVRDAGGW